MSQNKIIVRVAALTEAILRSVQYVFLKKIY